MKEEFTREITYKMKNGKIINTVKTFRNLPHFDNYYNKLVQSQCNDGTTTYLNQETNKIETIKTKLL